MYRPPAILRHYYLALREINYQVFGVVATGIFSILYIVVVPWFAVFAKKSVSDSKTNWHPWPFRSDTLDDLRKQY